MTSGPLAGVKVLDLTTVILGPFATQLLSELGAEVVKVEPPDGDNMRHVGPMRSPGMGAIYLNASRGKRSLVLNLKDARARDALLKLARSHDVLISNTRPRAMARLGLDYASVREHNPRIVYVTCCGYGQSGPYATQPAYDDLIQGAAGIPWLMQRYGVAEPCYVPLTVADRVTGLHSAYAIAAALYERERSGEGQAIEVPMFETLTQFLLGDHMAGLTFDPPVAGPGYDRLLTTHRRPYATRDGHLCVLIYNDKQWRGFFAAIGEPERFEADERFSSHTNRARHIDEVYAYVAEVMRTRTTDEWREILAEADIPSMPMLSPEDLLEDPHLQAVGFFGEQEHPSEGRLRTIAAPSGWSRSGVAEDRAPAPRFGEHSAELLREAGCDEGEIEALVRDGATVVAPPSPSPA